MPKEEIAYNFTCVIGSVLCIFCTFASISGLSIAIIIVRDGLNVADARSAYSTGATTSNADAEAKFNLGADRSRASEDKAD